MPFRWGSGDRALVIGADSQIGRSVCAALVDASLHVETTTHRDYDLRADPRTIERIAAGCACAIVSAGATIASECENDPVGTRAVNVTGTAQLIQFLSSLGIFVVWLSSNAVFSGGRPFPGLRDPHDPTTEYGRQKSDAEHLLSGLLDRVAIIRLTKVLSHETPLVREWLSALHHNAPIQPFNDRVLCPVSLNFSATAVADIARRGIGGVYHVSGREDVTYADVAAVLATAISATGTSVRPIASHSAQRSTLFTGKYASLDMAETTAALGLEPQGIGDVVADIVSPRRTAEFSRATPRSV